MNIVFTVEEVFYIASVMEDSKFKTRLMTIQIMELAKSGEIISSVEKDFIKKCVEKLKQITDNDFNNLNFLEAWTLIGADERDAI